MNSDSARDRQEVLQELTRYVRDELLEGNDDGLDERTPLLELGILNSLEVARMLSFIQRKYGVSIRAESVRVEDLATLSALAVMVRGALQTTRT